ncbi:WD40 repeat domain-containing protein [Bradyrhizobium diazoefficiens]|nr:WD40 repeat domain-containing protein [Bradyrhizobium diazoefficiens]MBR0704565.1 WD40 repeat domain-containing protein [Bradyrhizobium diazoefficiens]MBR0773133.1 WD40 repeat domain-containing protein [Bradyrhizobium diazoefficiens]
MFFGRDDAIRRLEAAVVVRRLTALVGASGSGKSSVALAGLAPRLHAGGGWLFTHFRVGIEPDKNPFLALARSLTPLLSNRSAVEQLEEIQALGIKLTEGVVDLPNLLGGCRAANPGKRILLIADQFEEIFTLVPDDLLRRRFIRLLLSGFEDGGRCGAPDVTLLLTLRADFYGTALQYGLSDALQDHVENLGPMTRDQLREAIVRPAGSIGFEGGLIDKLLDDVNSSPGNLPLLQFALRSMWSGQRNGLLTYDSYNEIGGINGAIAKRAEAVFEARADQGKDLHTAAIFRQLFTRLVALGEGTEDTRRVVHCQELGSEAWELAQLLANEENRLVVVNATAPGSETAEVAHEALIRSWPRLVEWVNRDRAFQSWLRQLRLRMADWLNHPEDDGTLLRGGSLLQAEEWYGRRASELTHQERSYIKACTDFRDALSERERERQERERTIELAKQRARWMRLTATGLTILLVLTMAAAGVAFRNYQLADQGEKAAAENQQAALISESRLLSFLSRQQTDSGDTRAGILLALKALPHPDHPRPYVGDAARALYVALAYHGSSTFDFTLDETQRPAEDALRRRFVDSLLVELRHPHQVNSAEFGPDGSVITASQDGAARLWDNAGRAIALLKHDGPVNSASFRRDGQRIVTASQDGTARIWDDRGQPVGVLRHHGPVVSAMCSPGGKLIVTASEDGTARVWNAAGEPLATLAHDVPVRSATFSPDGRQIVTVADDGAARIWNSEYQLAATLRQEQRITSAVFGPNGTKVLTGSSEGPAVLWDNRGNVIATDSWTGITAVGYSKVSWLFAIGTARGDVLVEVNDGVGMMPFAHKKGPVSSIAFRPDGKFFASAAADGNVRITRSFPPRWGVLAWILPHSSPVRSVTYSFDGGRVATIASDATVRIWRVLRYSELLSVAHSLNLKPLDYAEEKKFFWTEEHLDEAVDDDVETKVIQQ